MAKWLLCSGYHGTSCFSSKAVLYFLQTLYFYLRDCSRAHRKLDSVAHLRGSFDAFRRVSTRQSDAPANNRLTLTTSR